jgi:homoserine O-acetyltransferase
MYRFLFQFTLICMFASTAVAQTKNELRVADLRRCVLESGQAIEPCKVGFRTFGLLNAERTNVVLVPMWFYGKTEQLHPKVSLR